MALRLFNAILEYDVDMSTERYFREEAEAEAWELRAENFRLEAENFRLSSEALRITELYQLHRSSSDESELELEEEFFDPEE